MSAFTRGLDQPASTAERGMFCSRALNDQGVKRHGGFRNG